MSLAVVRGFLELSGRVRLKLRAGCWSRLPPPSLGCSGYFGPPREASWLLELCRGSIRHKEVGLGSVAWVTGGGWGKDEPPGA